MLIQAQSQKEDDITRREEEISIGRDVPNKCDEGGKDICIDPKTYCKLGHFHLLLEDYAKG